MAKSKYTNIDLTKYDGGFQGTDATRQAYGKKVVAEDKVANYGPFSYKNQDDYDNVMNQIVNREDFSYDLNGDILYQQYKDNYINQGKMAMMDTMGQAAAMTGGYGNSYAQTVGQQAYQGYLQNLNNIIPELYQLALDRYNAEGERLAQSFGVLSADRQTAYGEYNDGYNRLISDRDYYSDDYNNVYNRDYTQWNDNRNYDTTQYWNEHNAGYQAEQDAFANQIAREQLEEQKRANRVNESQGWARVNGGGTGGGGSPSVTATQTSRTDNFIASVLTPREFARRGKTATVNGQSKTYNNHNEYIEDVIRKRVENEELDEGEVAYLLDHYGIKY